jgi:hypothetical protein
LVVVSGSVVCCGPDLPAEPTYTPLKRARYRSGLAVAGPTVGFDLQTAVPCRKNDLRAAMGSLDSWPFPISVSMGWFVLVASAGADG